MHLVRGSFQNKFICLFSINKIIKIKILKNKNYYFNKFSNKKEKEKRRKAATKDFIRR
jgi:hypothetical protein